MKHPRAVTSCWREESSLSLVHKSHSPPLCLTVTEGLFTELEQTWCLWNLSGLDRVCKSCKKRIHTYSIYIYTQGGQHFIVFLTRLKCALWMVTLSVILIYSFVKNMLLPSLISGNCLSLGNNKGVQYLTVPYPTLPNSSIFSYPNLPLYILLP